MAFNICSADTKEYFPVRQSAYQVLGGEKNSPKRDWRSSLQAKYPQSMSQALMKIQ